MSRIDDEMLTAYLDGELDAEQMRHLEAVLERDPALKARLAAWERSDQALRLALMTASERVPEKALATILTATEERAPVSSHAGSGGWRDWFARLLSAPALAATTAALVVGIMIGVMVAVNGPRFTGPGQEGPASSAFLLAGGPLAVGLERMPSGREHLLDETGKRLALVATYRARDGRWCREFRLESAAAVGSATGVTSGGAGRSAALAGLACRQAGRWTVVALAPVAAGMRAPGAIYRPAADESLPLELARQMRHLGLATPLDGESEQRLLASGWSQPGR